MHGELSPDWDAIVIGSGLGGTTAAHELVRSGRRVLMLESERGGPLLAAGQVVTQLQHEGSRVTAVEAIDRSSGRPRCFRAETVVLAAGTVASPRLILASGLEQ